MIPNKAEELKAIAQGVLDAALSDVDRIVAGIEKQAEACARNGAFQCVTAMEPIRPHVYNAVEQTLREHGFFVSGSPGSHVTVSWGQARRSTM